MKKLNLTRFLLLPAVLCIIAGSCINEEEVQITDENKAWHTPSVPANPLRDFSDAENREALASARFPADFVKRTSISPGTNGYPDVDTWRDLVFYIESNP
ncbi:MAG: hypothetical protein ACUVTX_06270 [Bacteroidales bacterium]